MCEMEWPIVRGRGGAFSHLSDMMAQKMGSRIFSTRLLFVTRGTAHSKAP